MLVENTSDSVFVPQQRHDILVEAVRANEHGGRVCGVGRGVDLRLFIGSSSKSNEMHKKYIEELVDQRLEEKM